MLDVLINGVRPATVAAAVAVADRGLHYGDGVFETLLLRDGRVRLLERHLQRLSLGCERLALCCPDLQQLRGEICSISATAAEGVIKLLVTRGSGERGYAAPAVGAATRIVALYPPPAPQPLQVTAQWCEIRLGRNVHLAGIKHLNRLEQVLAQQQIAAAGVAEGLLLDSEGELVSAISSNIFLVRGGALLTPDLRCCGVKGVMRAEVMRVASALFITVHEAALRPADVQTAQEVLLTNAVLGLRSVVELGDRHWPVGPMAQRLREGLREQA